MNQSTEEIETFWDGMQRYTLDNQQISIIIGGADDSRESFDLWAEVILETLNQAPHPIYSFLLLEASSNNTFSPLARLKIHEIIEQSDKSRHHVVALLIRDSIINRLMLTFINTIIHRSEYTQHFTYEMFTSQDMALAWLRQKVTDYLG